MNTKEIMHTHQAVHSVHKAGNQPEVSTTVTHVHSHANGDFPHHHLAVEPATATKTKDADPAGSSAIPSMGGKRLPWPGTKD